MKPILRKISLIIIAAIMLITTAAAAEDPCIITKQTKTYASASTKSKSATVKKGTKATLITAKNSWGEILIDGKTRYIKLDYLKSTTGIPYQAKEKIALRKSKSNSGKKLATIGKNETVTLWKNDGKWAYVETTKGKKGYLPMKKLSRGENAGQANDSTSKTDELINYAKEQLGKPYRKNAKGPQAFDCSNFTAFCFKRIGVSISGSLQKQAKTTKNFTRIEKLSECKPGDILFFDSDPDNNQLIDHASIMLNKSSIIHASCSAKKVITSDISSFYKRTFVYAIRYNKL